MPIEEKPGERYLREFSAEVAALHRATCSLHEPDGPHRYLNALPISAATTLAAQLTDIAQRILLAARAPGGGPLAPYASTLHSEAIDRARDIERAIQILVQTPSGKAPLKMPPAPQPNTSETWALSHTLPPLPSRCPFWNFRGNSSKEEQCTLLAGHDGAHTHARYEALSPWWSVAVKEGP